MHKIRKLLLLVFVFAITFSTPAIYLNQASASKLDGFENESLKIEKPEIQLAESLIDPEDPNKVVRIIVELEGAPAIEFATDKGVLYKELPVVEREHIEGLVEKEQQNVQSKINTKTPSISYLETFTTVFNGFSAEVQAKDVEAIANLAGVKAVYESTEYKRPEVKTDMVYSKELVQAQRVWNDYKYNGEGMVVGIIDTGIDPSHRDMVLTNPENAAITEEFVNSKLADGTIANGKYFTVKVPFGYNYMDGNNEILDLGPTASMHGMHVAGTVGANGNEDDGGIKGVAPEVQLLALKVFGNDPGFESTYGDIYVKAMDDAIKLGADVLNLSLGSVAGFVDSENPEQQAVENATNNGILVAISAGNSDQFASGYYYPYAENQDYGLTGSPSVANSSLGVASLENTKITSEGYDYFYDGEKQGSSLFLLANDANPKDVLSGQYEVVYAGFGSASDYNKVDVKGKIALVSRGNGINFTDKGLNAQAAGAVAVIVHNNAAGTISMASDAAIKIPYMSSLQADGLALKEALDAGVKVTIKFNGAKVSIPNPAAGTMSTFTSWGPTPSLDFKPEITAPGGQIFSTLNNNEYGIMSGTSMAAPHVAGGAALLLQRIDENSDLIGADRVQLARTLLMNTALPVERSTGVYESPRRQGAGLMQIANAIETDVYVRDAATGEAKVALKEIKDNKFEFTLEVKNVSDEEKTYDVNLQLQVDRPIDGGNAYYTLTNTRPSYVLDETDYTADYASSITIPANSTETLTISADITNSAWLYDYFTNGYFVDGFVTLTDATDTEVPLVVPFFGFNGSWDDAPIFDYFAWDAKTYYGYTALLDGDLNFITGGDLNLFTDSEDINFNPSRFGFSPNGDGVQDSVLPLFSLFRNVTDLKVEVTDVEGKVLRKIATLSNLTKNYSSSAPYKLNSSLAWDGKINGKVAPDGDYFIKLSGVIDFEGAEWQSIQFPIKVDTFAPTVDVDLDEENLNLIFANYADKEGGTGYYYTTISINGELIEAVPSELETFQLPENLTNNDIVTVEVFDAAGNSSLQEFRTEKTETGKPVIYITSPEYLEGFATSEVLVEGTIEDFSNIKSVKVNGEEATLDGLSFRHVLTLEDGVRDVRVEAIDEFDNSIQIARKVIVDTTAPTLTVTSYNPTTTSSKEIITVNIQDNFDEIVFHSNGNEEFKNDLSEPYDMIGFNEDITFEVELEEGQNTFELVVYDALRHTATETITITKSTSPDEGTEPTPDPGTPDPGTPDPGTPDPGTPDPGTPDPGTPDPGTPDPGTPNPGTPDPGTPDPGTPNPGTPDRGTPTPAPVSTPAPTSSVPNTVDNSTGDESKSNVNLDSSITDQLSSNSEDKVAINLDLASEGEQKVNASLSNEILQKLVDSERPLVISVNGSTVTIPVAVLAQILTITSGKGNVTFSINLNEIATTSTGQQLTNVIDLSITSIVGDKEVKISEFTEKVSITLPLTTDVNDFDKVAVYYIDEETGTLHYVQSKVVDGQIIFKTGHFSKFVVLEQNVTFKDLEKYDWARKFIESLASKLIINGKGEDTFAPADQITREEFAVLLVRALDIPKSSYEGLFADVSEANSWSVLEIEAASRAGIVTGYDGKFNPKQNITREQMVTMIIRALNYDSPKALNDVKPTVTFQDAGIINDYAKESIGYAVSKGIVDGVELNNQLVFAPDAFATRAEAAKMLYSLLSNLE